MKLGHHKDLLLKVPVQPDDYYACKPVVLVC
jgi:hypothetical protein